MNWGDLGMDGGTGTIGANSLGDVHDSAQKATDRKPKRCQEPGCGTILRSTNPDVYCSVHTFSERKGKRYTDGLARARWRRMHVVKSYSPTSH